MAWTDVLRFDNTFDGIARLIFVIAVGAYAIMNSTIFEAEYSDKLIELYTRPWWRLLVVILVIMAAVWCPRVGIIFAFVVFFYMSDMETLITPFAVA